MRVFKCLKRCQRCFSRVNGVFVFAAAVVSCPNQTEVVRDDDALLQCRLAPQLDLSDDTVDWKRDKEVVHVYRSKRDDPHSQTERYRNRTTLNHEHLHRGILTLKISSVQPSDSGKYKCYVPQQNASCFIKLVVGEHAEFNTDQFKVFIIQDLYNETAVNKTV